MKPTHAQAKKLFILLFLLLCGLGSSVKGQQSTAQATQEIPTVGFCEMVKRPREFFDKPVRLTAVYTMATEASYLSDEKCPLTHDDQIGVKFDMADEKQRELLYRELEKFHSIEYGGQARFTVAGILRNKSRRDFAWYHYRFDIMSIEKIAHLVVPYEGELQAGKTYRAAVRVDSRAELTLVIPLRMPEHHAVHIEWTNLTEFPELKKSGNSTREQHIVFSVIFDERKQMTAQRWNRTIKCKIIRIE